MRLSTVIIVQGLLLSGIIASPIAAPEFSEDSTDISLAADSKQQYNLCFEQTKSENCYQHSVEACVKKHKENKDPDADAFCSFWCSEIKTVDDCKSLKKSLNYNPSFACDEQKYC
ncbi:putative secreted protein [Wickerhamomyces ciferrii]|uniref:Secreted protein n=1 Tax=Wickerhamomyces ciferrii (strain ATCC 14091 / BCRC 22168 / CBS 111 / JCM 3599 / NBRC 0793 / NRRL Y-1031 F-60-10) TaxID=1206466 RepID=K0KZG6_WICCF|nr:uncharacterized protein BN7_6121 [Wickerhamomyces ciferrii]CCH46528.1 putative secreted protein [Wickerhamomyces ciferrii]